MVTLCIVQAVALIVLEIVAYMREKRHLHEKQDLLDRVMARDYVSFKAMEPTSAPVRQKRHLSDEDLAHRELARKEQP